MKYVVFQTGGKQYKVTEGSILEVEKLTVQAGEEVSFANILLSVADGAIQIGKPFLAGAVITAKVLEQTKGPKIRVAKFKAKSRHRRVTGHRQSLTKVQITKIGIKDSDESTKAVTAGKNKKVKEKTAEQS